MKDTRYYVGMDVHKAITVIVVLNSKGKQVMKILVETTANNLISAIRSLRGCVHLTFEEGTHASWLYDLLKPYAAQILVCNARAIIRAAGANKSDDADAYQLAELLRLGSLKSVYHGEQSMRTLQELARSYQYLVSDCTRIKNRIKAVFRARGISYHGDDIYHPEQHEHWLSMLSENGVRIRTQNLYAQLDMLLPLRVQAEQAMIGEARRQPDFRLLKSIPYLGEVRVSLIIASGLTPHRFRTKRQFWAYSGFAVKTRSSADYISINGVIKKAARPVLTRGLNENFNRTLKQVFKSTANAANSGVLKDFYENLLAKGIKPQMARLTLARKIAAITLSVWKKGERFNPDKLMKQVN